MSDRSDNTNQIQKSLLVFGLTTLEGKIYLFLSGGEAKTVVTIARVLGVARTSIYDTLAKLIEKRLVVRVVMSKSSRYKAVGVERLGELMAEEKERVREMGDAYKVLREKIQVSQLTANLGTEVRYYEGVEGMKQMIWNCLKARDEIVGYSVFGRVEVVGVKYYQRFVGEFEKRSLKDRVVANDNKRTMDYILKDVKPGFHQLAFQNIRVLSEKKLYIAGDTMIYNDIYAVGYWQDGAVVGVEIESPEFVRSQRSIFELLWERAKVVE